MSSPCEYEHLILKTSEDIKKFDIIQEKLSEINADVKVLVIEIRNITLSLINSTTEFKEHIKNGEEYRKKIELLWNVSSVIKWIIILAFGSGVTWEIIKLINK